MIKANKIQNCLNDFDSILSQYCNGVVENGELHALAGWVNQPCLDDLNAALARYLIPGNQVRFMLAWIDKSPIAEYTPSGAAASISGELADVAIIRLLIHSKQTAIAQLGRMMLLQAKATKANPPFVPSAVSRGQTPKEWGFMTSWPPFTLRDWGASSGNNACFDAMQGIAPADREKKMRQMNWFGVAPFYPAQKQQWAAPPYDSSPWWTAPPDQGRACDTALSKLLVKIALASEKLDVNDVDGQAGRDFQFAATPSTNPATMMPPLTWDDLANEIIAVASRNAPATQQIFATSRIIQFLTTHSPTPILGVSGRASGATGDKPFPVIFVTHFE